MEELIPLILIGLKEALFWAVEQGVKYIIKKVVDSAGNVVTHIIYEYDSDGDGENDSEQIIYTLDTMIPDLSNGYCLCNKGDEIGLGMPQFKLLDGFEIADLIDTDIITGNDNGFIIDLDSDGENDDILIPFPDFTGDGYNDWGWLVDDDDNGLPDVSPYSPFYPVGSEEYTYIIEQQSPTEATVLDKPFDNYTVSEGLLLFIAAASIVYLFSKIFRRRKL